MINDNESISDEDQQAYLIRSKLISMLILGGCSIVSGLTPLILFSIFRKRSKKTSRNRDNFPNNNNNNHRTFDTYEKILSYGLLFGGGVLLSTVFLHLLPELTESIEKLEEDKVIDRTPIAYPEMLMCFGFFLMFTVEELVRECVHKNRRPSSSGSVGDELDAVSSDDNNAKTIDHRHDTAAGITNASFVACEALDAITANTSNVSDSGNRNVVINGLAVVEDDNCFYNHHHLSSDEARSVMKNSRTKYKNYSSCDINSNFNNNNTNNNTNNNNTDNNNINNNNNNNNNNSNVHSHVYDVSPTLRNFLIVLALSVHEIFEGLAVGLEKYPHLVWALLTAVMCHKLVLAGCVGLQLAGTTITDTAIELSVRRPWINYSYVIFFALTSPIGIGVGTFLSANTSPLNAPYRMISVILQGIATGTLLYIIFFEILKEHQHHFQIRGLPRVLCLLLGFVFMVTLQVFLSEDD